VLGNKKEDENGKVNIRHKREKSGLDKESA